MKEETENTALPQPRFAVSGHGRKAIARTDVAIHPQKPDVVLERRPVLVPSQDAERLRAPGRETRGDTVTHEEI